MMINLHVLDLIEDRLHLKNDLLINLFLIHLKVFYTASKQLVLERLQELLHTTHLLRKKMIIHYKRQRKHTF
jgi:hypothetical protein